MTRVDAVCPSISGFPANSKTLSKTISFKKNIKFHLGGREQRVRGSTLDEQQFQLMIRTAFNNTDDYIEGFQHAVQAVIKETGLNGVEARWLVMRLRGG